MSIQSNLKKVFWSLPFPGGVKEKMRIRYAEKKMEREQRMGTDFELSGSAEDYAKYVLHFQDRSYEEVCSFEKHETAGDSAIIIAYYLTQYSPDRHNDAWWGKGVTEWNNVTSAVPQFVGHRQPQLPGELGFYDLRIKDVMRRQIELAKNYGVNVFSFYYYWFAGERLLEKPLNMFLEDSTLDMPFMFCWANENWTRNFSGTDASVLIGMDNTVENYKAYIHEIMPYLQDPRYFTLEGKPVLQVYRPGLIPEPQKVIDYWRDAVRKECGRELYLIACQGRNLDTDWSQEGFDAENEWMMDGIKGNCNEITSKVSPIRKDFCGTVYDYEQVVKNRQYIIPKNRTRKVYPAVMPAWDNTARRNNKGTIFHGANPKLYQKWLTDIIHEVQQRSNLDAPLVFINAWNEWGEGAYLEPNRDFGYGYLQATWEAKQGE